MKRKNLIKIIMPIFIAFLSSVAFSDVHTRLVLVSNNYDTPSAGQGTLIIDVEAISDGSQEFIRVFQNAFQLDVNLRGQSPIVSFLDQRFPDDLVQGSPNYNVTEEYDSEDGRVSYTYTFNAGLFNTIETTYTKVVRVSIQYTMAAVNGSVTWYDGIPNFSVTNSGNNNITGNEEAISGPLTDISLPVELSSFSAEATDDGKVVLNWTTESEINNLGFEISRAYEQNREYTKLADYQSNPALLGQGNTNTKTEYSLIDENVKPGMTYWYKLADLSYNGTKAFHAPKSVEVQILLPDHFKLLPNFPNPFNPSTTIAFDIPEKINQSTTAHITIYNILGKKIKNISLENLNAGRHEFRWDGNDDFNNTAAGGIYFYSLVIKQNGLKSYSETKRMILLK